jgi:hypothetical protein
MLPRPPGLLRIALATPQCGSTLDLCESDQDQGITTIHNALASPHRNQYRIVSAVTTSRPVTRTTFAPLPFQLCRRVQCGYRISSTQAQRLPVLPHSPNIPISRRTSASLDHPRHATPLRSLGRRGISSALLCSLCSIPRSMCVRVVSCTPVFTKNNGYYHRCKIYARWPFFPIDANRKIFH